jgi:hypothetical protein
MWVNCEIRSQYIVVELYQIKTPFSISSAAIQKMKTYHIIPAINIITFKKKTLKIFRNPILFHRAQNVFPYGYYLYLFRY